MMRLGATPQSSVPLPPQPALAPYTRAEDLLSDLTMLRDSLVQNRGHRLSELLVDPLLLEVRTYGLHLQTLDIRQHAKVHTAAINELSATTVGGESHLAPALSPQTAEVVDTFRTIAELKQTYAPEAIRQYVISGATSAEDVLNVLRLARLGGVSVEASPASPYDPPRAIYSKADTFDFPTPACSSSRSSNQSKTFRTPPPSCAPCGPATPTSRCSKAGTIARRSCSATPTPTRTAA